METMLSLDQVCFSYHTVGGETLALSDITFSVDCGEFAAIVGPSGCGKSTLLSLICGLIKPESGKIRMAGRQDNTPANGIGYMLQKDHLFEWRSVYDNILLGLEIQKKLTEQNLERIDRMLKTYGLSSFAQMKPSALSGGMKQRAALIRTLALDPDLLLLDEPFSALDYQTRLEVADDIGTTRLIRSHQHGGPDYHSLPPSWYGKASSDRVVSGRVRYAAEKAKRRRIFPLF